MRRQTIRQPRRNGNPALLLRDQAAHNRRNALTAREWQVFDLLICGLSNKQMAHELAISPRTVEIHRARILQKMGVRNTASLIRIAMTAA